MNPKDIGINTFPPINLIEGPAYDRETQNAEMANKIAQMQVESDQQLARGDHPFPMLEKLNHHTLFCLNKELILIANVGSHYSRRRRPGNSIDEIQLKILDALKPFWDLGEANFSGKFFLKFEIAKDVRMPLYVIKISLAFNELEDLDNFQVMRRLQGLTELIELVF